MVRRLPLLVRCLAIASCALLLSPAPVAAQVPTGTLSGRVIDSSGGAVQGATVTITSSSLQGRQTRTTTEHGDYIFRSLPPGLYFVTVERAGFAPIGENAQVAVSETVPLNFELQPAAVTESVSVVASEDASFVNTVQAAARLPVGLLTELPTTRTLESYVNLAPGVTTTGPSGNITIAGAMSFENLFLVNGAVISDNIRSEPLPLYIEDAVQEVTVATSGISAEYGRFSGGVVNMVTKSGGNTFSGSYRTDFDNDDWRTVSPFGEPKVNKVNPVHSVTFGGPIVRDRLWFFGAGRFQSRETAELTALTRIPYTETAEQERYEAKVTVGLPRAHRLQAVYFHLNQDAANTNGASIGFDALDLRSLANRRDPMSLTTVNYTGTLGSSLAFEAQYSGRRWTIKDLGGLDSDLIQGTPIYDQSTGFSYWAPGFCGRCDDVRDNDVVFLKGSYFTSTAAGSHNVIFGYDTFNDRQKGDNRQSSTDYWLFGTAANIIGTDVHPVLDEFTAIVHWPLEFSSQGTNFRTHAFFLNDTWAVNNRLTFNLGLRYDANRGKNSSGQLVADGSLVSPRLGLVFDPIGDGRTTFHASYGRYVAPLANSIANSSSSAGTPSIIVYPYLGPQFNLDPDAPQVPTEQVIREAFDWFEANRADLEPIQVTLPGVATQIRGSLASPHADEIAVGVSRQIGDRGTVRVDLVDRQYGNLYVERVDTTTGTVFNELGEEFDLTLVENTDLLERHYTGVTVLGTYRGGTRLNLGASYTLSKLRGNIEGEDAFSGPLPEQSLLYYPEYSEPQWTNPTGDLSADQRHRARLWGAYNLPFGANVVTLSVLEQIQSGTPYGGFGTIALFDADDNPYVPDVGYQTPPDRTGYFFTDRDAFRTETMYRTDLALNYERRFGTPTRGFDVFAQFHILNLFNQFQAFNLTAGEIDTTILTAVNDPNGELVPFNPFTETPVEGVHWRFGEDFGRPTNKDAYTLPRTFRFSVGLRF